MKPTRRATLVYALFLSCATVIITLWLIGDEDVGEDGTGTLYRVIGAPILELTGLSNLTNAGRTSGIYCYDDKTGNAIDEIVATSVVKEDSIFFHETSCSSTREGTLVLSPRQACAVESAAKMNPDKEVYILLASPVKQANTSLWWWPARQLLFYNNIRIRHVNIEHYLEGTPLEEWYKEGALKKSRWPMSHSSDVLRFITLWKYGGTYLDLDVVVTKSLNGLKNFAGAESSVDVAVGVVNFHDSAVGREMANACLEDLREHFRGDTWGNNGPGVITRVLQARCKVKKARDMTPESCQGFTVHPPKDFYPIHWRKWALYFDEERSGHTMAKLKEATAIHVWNKFSVHKNVTVGSKQPYALIAQHFCPRVYSHAGPVF